MAVANSVFGSWLAVALLLALASIAGRHTAAAAPAADQLQRLGDARHERAGFQQHQQSLQQPLQSWSLHGGPSVDGAASAAGASKGTAAVQLTSSQMTQHERQHHGRYRRSGAELLPPADSTAADARSALYGGATTSGATTSSGRHQHRRLQGLAGSANAQVPTPEPPPAGSASPVDQSSTAQQVVNPLNYSLPLVNVDFVTAEAAGRAIAGAGVTRVTISSPQQRINQDSFQYFLLDYGAVPRELNPQRLFSISGAGRVNMALDIDRGLMYVVAEVADNTTRTAVSVTVVSDFAGLPLVGGPVSMTRYYVPAHRRARQAARIAAWVLMGLLLAAGAVAVLAGLADANLPLEGGTSRGDAHTASAAAAGVGGAGTASTYAGTSGPMRRGIFAILLAVQTLYVASLLRGAPVNFAEVSRQFDIFSGGLRPAWQQQNDTSDGLELGSAEPFFNRTSFRLPLMLRRTVLPDGTIRLTSATVDEQTVLGGTTPLPPRAPDVLILPPGSAADGGNGSVIILGEQPPLPPRNRSGTATPLPAPAAVTPTGQNPREILLGPSRTPAEDGTLPPNVVDGVRDLTGTPAPDAQAATDSPAREPDAATAAPDAIAEGATPEPQQQTAEPRPDATPEPQQQATPEPQQQNTPEPQQQTAEPATDGPVRPPATAAPLDPSTDPPSTDPPVAPPNTDPPVAPPMDPPIDPPTPTGTDSPSDPSTDPSIDPPPTDPPVSPTPTDPPPTDPPVSPTPTDPPPTDPPVDPPTPVDPPPPTDPPVDPPTPVDPPPPTDPPVDPPTPVNPPPTDPPVDPPPPTDPPVDPPTPVNPPPTDPPVDPPPTDPPVDPPPTDPPVDPPPTDPPVVPPPTDPPVDPPPTDPPVDPPPTDPPVDPPPTDPPVDPPPTDPPVDPPPTDPPVDPPPTDPPVDPPPTDPPVNPPPTDPPVDPPPTDPPVDPPPTDPPVDPPPTDPPVDPAPETDPPMGDGSGDSQRRAQLQRAALPAEAPTATPQPVNNRGRQQLQRSSRSLLAAPEAPLANLDAAMLAVAQSASDGRRQQPQRLARLPLAASEVTDANLDSVTLAAAERQSRRRAELSADAGASGSEQQLRRSGRSLLAAALVAVVEQRRPRRRAGRLPMGVPSLIQLQLQLRQLKQSNVTAEAEAAAAAPSEALAPQASAAAAAAAVATPAPTASNMTAGQQVVSMFGPVSASDAPTTRSFIVMTAADPTLMGANLTARTDENVVLVDNQPLTAILGTDALRRVENLMSVYNPAPSNIYLQRAARIAFWVGLAAVIFCLLHAAGAAMIVAAGLRRPAWMAFPRAELVLGLLLVQPIAQCAGELVASRRRWAVAVGAVIFGAIMAGLVAGGCLAIWACLLRRRSSKVQYLLLPAAVAAAVPGSTPTAASAAQAEGSKRSRLWQRLWRPIVGSERPSAAWVHDARGNSRSAFLTRAGCLFEDNRGPPTEPAETVAAAHTGWLSSIAESSEQQKRGAVLASRLRPYATLLKVAVACFAGFAVVSLALGHGSRAVVIAIVAVTAVWLLYLRTLTPLASRLEQGTDTAVAAAEIVMWAALLATLYSVPSVSHSLAIGWLMIAAPAAAILLLVVTRLWAWGPSVASLRRRYATWRRTAPVAGASQDGTPTAEDSGEEAEEGVWKKYTLMPLPA